MSRTKKKTRGKTKQNNTTTPNNKDIKGIAIICIGLLLGISIYTELAGALSIFSRKVIYNFIGIGTYVAPLYIIYYGYHTISSKGKISYSRKLLGITTVSIMIILFCSTANLQNNEITTFGETLKIIMQQEYGVIHGGLLGYIISYPLNKLVGFIGSYILYTSIIFVGTILTLDITILDIINYIKPIFGNLKIEKKPKKEKTPKKNAKTTPKEQVFTVEEDERDEFINGINNKIQILDFMKNSVLDDEIPNSAMELDDQEAISIPFSNNDNIDLKEHHDNVQAISKEEPVDIVINKEIEDKLTDTTSPEEFHYRYPSTDLLNNNAKNRMRSEDKKDLFENANKLEETLSSFGVEAKVLQVTKGPSVTRFELQPSPGVKVSKIVNLQDDIALGLAASGVRMEAPIPGKSAIGIEVPNKKQSPVYLREVLDSKEFTNSSSKLSFALGKDIAGKCVVGDLSKMPHMLIAGATGSGKSVCINTLIISILYKYSPSEVKLLMVDPKVVELSVYNGIPHLLIPVVTDPKKAAGALNWAVNEMNRRYNLFSTNKVKNIESYNNLYEKGVITEKLPFIVMIVDELADLMMACPNDVEDYICRLAQMARAAGMHLIIATQRPSVDVITGVIKANIPSRISFAVSSGIDSRTILDQVGAEKLLGRGDMLYYPIGESKPLRVQGAFISEEEVENVVEYVKTSDFQIDYKEEILNHINSDVKTEAAPEEERDELLEEAIKTVVEYQQASTSFLQRKLRVGFNRASRIMDELEEQGVISGKDGSRPRQVLISKDEVNNNM